MNMVQEDLKSYLIPDLLGPYVRRWTAWVQGGLEGTVELGLEGGLFPSPGPTREARQADAEQN